MENPIPEDYRPKEHRIESFNPIVTSQVIIKPYSMRSLPKEPFSKETIETMGRVIRWKLIDGTIPSGAGLGFAIATDGFINVGMWGVKEPYLANNYLFGFDKLEDILGTLSQLDIRKEGAYCVWEFALTGHEGKAWREYLKSERTETDRLRYVGNVFSGIVS